MSISDEIKRLEYLSLVSKVVTELENHLDISEKCLGKLLWHSVSQKAATLRLGYSQLFPPQFCLIVFIAAEFIIHLAEKHPTFDEFKAALCENGAHFTVWTGLRTRTWLAFPFVLAVFSTNLFVCFQDTFTDNLLRLINTMRSAPSTSKGIELIECSEIQPEISQL